MAGADFDRRITMGFKLLSGFYGGAISKPDLEVLGSNADVEWANPRFERLAGEVSSALQNIGLFSTWKSWGFSLANLASDAVAMNFLLLVTKDWELRGRPTAGGAPRDRFQKNARILLDRMVYEYVVGRWRGSSDSRIARNLERFPTDISVVWDPVDQAEWDALIDEAVDQGTIAGDPYYESGPSGPVKLLLLYFYCLKGLTGPGKKIDVDHIVPQRKFGSLTADEQKKFGSLMNNICNLAFLPRGDNIVKRDRTLCEIEKIETPADERDWLLEQISKFTNIPKSDFTKFCDAASVITLQELRGQEFKKIFKETRATKLELLT